MRKIAIILVLFLSVFSLQAQDTRKQESQKAKLEKEIAQLQKQLDENSKKSNNAHNEIVIIQRQISNRRALVKESDKEIKAIDDSIKIVNAIIADFQSQIDTLSKYYTRLVRTAYKNRDTRIWYVYILASKDFSQATRRFSYLRNLSHTMNLRAEELKDLKDQQALALVRLEDLREDAAKLRRSRQAELDKLAKEEKRSKQLITQLNKNKSSYQKQIKSKQKQVENLNKEIQKIINQYVQSQKKKLSEAEIVLSTNFASNKGKLPWPADGPVLEKYGKQTHPVYKSLSMPFNNGIGIGLTKGTSIKAIFDGEVKRVIVMPGYNKCVLIQHGEYFSFYCKLENVSVKAGDKVTTGQVIGTVDTIDGQTQLHLQIWKEKTPQNPETWLRKR